MSGPEADEAGDLEAFARPPRIRPEPDPEAVERAGAALAKLLAELPASRPWTRRPTPATHPSEPA